MRKNDYGTYFKFIRSIVRIVIPRYRFENMPTDSEAVVFVAHHQNLLGPISTMAWLEEFVRVWAFSVFNNQKTCYEHYVDYTFTKRFGWPTALAKIIAWPASYLIAWLIRSAQAIPVYRKSRNIIKTLKLSVEALIEGESVLIFPQVEYTSDASDISNIYEGFLNLDKYYFRKTNQHLKFVPLLSDKEQKIIRAGKPVQFSGEISFIEERKEIARKIEEELFRLANINKYQNI